MKNTNKEKEYIYCSACNGTGEGYHSGSGCRKCGGLGEVIDDSEKKDERDFDYGYGHTYDNYDAATLLAGYFN